MATDPVPPAVAPPQAEPGRKMAAKLDPAKPACPPPVVDAIPAALRDLTAWVGWRFECTGDGKGWAKVEYVKAD